jgi:hypothetical protein
MTYTDHYLRWMNEKAWDDALLDAQTNPDTLQGVTIDVVGTIWAPAKEGDKLPRALDGWHVNVRCAPGVALPPAFSTARIEPPPATPTRVFA